MPWREAVGRTAPFADVLVSITGVPAVRVLFLATAFVGAVGVMNSTLDSSAQMLYGLSRFALVSRAFSALHPKYGTPARCIWFTAAFVVLTPFTGRLFFLPFINIASLATIVMWIMSLAAVLRLRRARPDLRRPVRMPGGRVTAVLGEGASVFLAGNVLLPFSPGALDGLEYALAAALAVSLLGIRSRALSALSGALMAAFPAVGYTFLYLFTASAYCFAIFLAVLSVSLARRGRWHWLAGCLLLACSMGTYQAYVTVAIGLSLLVIFRETLDPSASFSATLRLGVRLMLFLAAGAVLYYGILLVFLQVKDLELLSYLGMDAASSGYPFSRLPGLLLDTCKQVAAFFFLPGSANTFTSGWMAVLDLAALALGGGCFLLCMGQEGLWRARWRPLGGLAMLALLLRDALPEVDMDKVLRMCLIHDVGEAVTGDIPSFQKTDANEEIERQAIAELLYPLPDGLRGELTALFAEMDALATPEARVYKALDKLEVVVQYNEAPLDTWLPLEYELNQTYGIPETAPFPPLAALREQARLDTLAKLAEKPGGC